MIKVPGQGPYVPPPIPPKKGEKAEETTQEIKRPAPQAPKEGGVKGPEMDARAIAVRMAALAHQAKEKELSFEEIVQRAIEETGMTNPQAAMEEANRKLQKEIEDVLEEIKSNKELMEEAEAWETFAQILEKELSEEQVENFLGIIKDSIKAL